MSTDTDGNNTHIGDVEVDEIIKKNISSSEISSDSGIETSDSSSSTSPASNECDPPSIKSILNSEIDKKSSPILDTHFVKNYDELNSVDRSNDCPLPFLEEDKTVAKDFIKVTNIETDGAMFGVGKSDLNTEEKKIDNIGPSFDDDTLDSSDLATNIYVGEEITNIPGANIHDFNNEPFKCTEMNEENRSLSNDFNFPNISPVSSPRAQNTPVSPSNSDNSSFSLTNHKNRQEDNISYSSKDLNDSRFLATSTISLDNEMNTNNIICKSPFSRSAENISLADQNSNKSTNSSTQDLNADIILSQFSSQKQKASATQKIPENTTANAELKYPRIPKEILSQDIGSIVKNVHGIFSSVSGSLKYAYTQRTNAKPVKPVIKSVPTGKVMNDIFEDDTVEVTNTDKEKEEPILISDLISNSELEELEGDSKNDTLKPQLETLERLLAEQKREIGLLKERVKQQDDEIQGKEHTFKEMEAKVESMNKRVEQAEREKDAAVMRYASVECAAIEARRSADAAKKAELAAQTEVELLNVKLKSAHGEKHRICQLYDDKCHELMTTERDLVKVREELRELEGRLKWTQSKLRMEMDAYKESSERAEKLAQQVTDLEAAIGTANANATDSAKAKLYEAELKECRAALILLRHEKEESERRLTSTAAALSACERDRDTAVGSLARATDEVSQLKLSNHRLEEEAAELAALRAQAALADTLSAQLERETERAAQAEEALSVERALAETCGRREAAALEHAARVTAQHVAQRASAEQHQAAAQALGVDNASLRERGAALDLEVEGLRAALELETQRRHQENRVLARKVAELTDEAAELTQKLEWERGENGVLKKKHSSAIKELNRELHRTLKRCEMLEAKLPPPDAPSTRTGSISSLSSGEVPPEERLQNGHAESVPEVQVREPDKQALIERIVSLQRAAARRAERCDFLEEHAKQLTGELRNKSRLLRQLLVAMPAGAVTSEDRDLNKKEIARLGGGAMAAVWGGDPGGMSPELSLEMNKRLQAVLEDTLLKNMTLKENIDTLGAEISRLKQNKKATAAPETK